jgi:hypothetical protein
VVALNERERAILDFERSWWMRDGSKEAAIKDELGLSSARYYQLLGGLLKDDDALAYDPLLVRRLRRLRDRRRRARFEGPSATPGRQ